MSIEWYAAVDPDKVSGLLSVKAKRAPKRDLFAELAEGMCASLAQALERAAEERYDQLALERAENEGMV